MRRIGILVSATAMAGIAALAAASPAYAATYHVTNGGTALSFKGSATLTDTATGAKLNCPSSALTIDAPPGSGNGAPLGTITAVSFSSCTGPLNESFTVTASGLPWPLDASSYSGGVTSGTVRLGLSLSGPLCTAAVSGTEDWTYTNSDHTLVIGAGATPPTVTSASCLGTINAGDPASFAATYVEQGSGPYLSVT
jgi:hypothetical protein